eukprot:gene7644-7847_t
MAATPIIHVAADTLADGLREALVQHIQAAHPSFVVKDHGTHGKYYEIAHKVGGLVQQSRAAGGQDRAVLCCGTGVGMSIIANKYPDVYAAVVESAEAAGNAAAINNANVLTLGAMVFEPREAAAAVDKWLGTKLTEGYREYKDFLETSMTEIPTMLSTATNNAVPSSTIKAAQGGIPFPAMTLLVDGNQPGSWQPISGMGHDSCMWCKLREDAAAGGGTSTRVRALARFPAGAIEPPHHHNCGHDELVIRVTYHTDTVFLIAFDGELELIWEDPCRAAGVEWESAEAKSAAENRAWPSGSNVLHS